jgi:hypothetical protein
MLILHHILDTQQCKTIMTLSDHKGKQIITDTIQKVFPAKFSNNVYSFKKGEEDGESVWWGGRGWGSGSWGRGSRQEECCFSKEKKLSK